MKRFALVLALSAAAMSASAQYYDDGYGSPPPDDGYYDDQYAAQEAYAQDGYDQNGYDQNGYDQGGYDQGYADDPAAMYDVARVLSVDPIVERGQQPVQRQQCWSEPVRSHAYNRYPQPRTSGGGAVVGAIVGGALGNTVGHGDGRQAATVLGALIGGAIGNDVERNNIQRQDAYYGRVPVAVHPDDQAVRRCRVVTDYRPDERVVGYRVNYEYGGRTYQTVTDYHPGSEMRVRVDVTPVN